MQVALKVRTIRVCCADPRRGGWVALGTELLEAAPAAATA
jgi:hypothetical protein